MHRDLQKVLVTREQLQERVRSLGAEITALYRQEDEITAIAIINGALLFAADLIREINLPLRLECLRVSSYQDDTSPVKRPEILENLRIDVKGRHVLVIDDVLDTGHTFSLVRQELKRHKPASLRFAVLLEKTDRREVAGSADFVGFKIPNEFVVGYGLDFAGHYRNLDCIGVLKPECQNPPEWR